MATGSPSASVRLHARDPVEVVEFCYEQGWAADGLPVVPPVPWRVQQMLDAGGRAADEELGFIAFRRRRVTVGRVAANAVMAGCRPEYFPAVLACVEAMLEERFGLHLAAASTHSPAILVVVNGPLRQQIGVNCANNALSPGWRANATIGRAIRLFLLNVCGAAPDSFDGGTMGNPAKYAYCLGEHEEASPWAPLHAERGLPPETSAVTLFAADAPRQINCRLSQDPEIILRVIVDMMIPAGNGTSRPNEGGFLIVMSPEHASLVGRRGGWSKAAVRRYLWEHACRPVADFKRLARVRGALEAGDETRPLHLAEHPDDIFLAVAGSSAGLYSLIIPIQGHQTVITKPVQRR
ncbi:MAG: hypothetical protein HYU88_10490 [Chloroflexi bacterium]|nr:hypothetical protein [Chloroflexota bacterium]